MIVSLTIGLISSIVAFFYFRRGYKFVRNGIKATAKVVHVDSKVDGEGDTQYVTTLEYRTVDNRSYHLKTDTYDKNKCVIGYEHMVIYNAAAPTQVEFMNLVSLYPVAIGATILAVPCLLFAFLTYLGEIYLLK